MKHNSCSNQELEILDKWFNDNSLNQDMNEKQIILSRLLYSFPTVSLNIKQKIQYLEMELERPLTSWRKDRVLEETSLEDLEWKNMLIQHIHDMELAYLVIDFFTSMKHINNSREIFLEQYLQEYVERPNAKDQLDLLFECAKSMEASYSIYNNLVGQLTIMKIKRQVQAIMEPLGINRFSQKVLYLEAQGIWGTYLLDYYSIRDLQHLERCLVWSRDRLLHDQSLTYLLENCLSCGCKNRVLELPQEMWMGMAMCLAIPYTSKRVQKAKEFYEQLSTLCLDPRSSCFLEIRSCLRSHKEVASHVIQKLTSQITKK